MWHLHGDIQCKLTVNYDLLPGQGKQVIAGDTEYFQPLKQCEGMLNATDQLYE